MLRPTLPSLLVLLSACAAHRSDVLTEVPLESVFGLPVHEVRIGDSRPLAFLLDTVR
jgi:hypothetical protein